MKRLLFITLIILAATGIFLLAKKAKDEKPKRQWLQGLKILKEKIKEINPSISEKKYYYVNIWINWCKPCVREMPWLDSIAAVSDREICYLFVSDLKDETAEEIIQRRNFRFKKFTLLNNMEEFVTGLCEEVGRKSRSYPMVLVLSETGEIVHFSVGAYSNPEEALGFESLLRELD